MDPLPAFRRDLDVSPSEENGRTVFVVRDRSGFGPEGTVLAPAGFAVAAFLDGVKDADAVAGELSRLTGSAWDAGTVRRVAGELESAGLLETPALLAARAKFLDDQARSRVREAALAGRSYPAGADALTAELGAYFAHPEGPGPPPPAASGPPLRGLFTPHIDFRRGGVAYAHAYRALAETEPPDAVLALGVAHVSPRSPWALSPKTYRTPLGDVRVHETLYDAIASCLPYPAAADEWTHRTEHSLEFQAVWLRHVWGHRAPCWVPVLCSTFEAFGPGVPSESPEIERALARIGDALKARTDAGERILVLGGVDLAHVGLCFGDRAAPDAAAARRIEDEDRASMGRALRLDADGFYRSVTAGGHWRKVCGLSAIYTALRCIASIGGAEGELLRYGQAPDPRGGLVSFASARFR